MSVTNTVEAVPVRLMYLLSALAEVKSGIAPDDLRDLFLPLGDDSSVYSNPLRELKSLGFILEDAQKGVLTLDPELRKRIPKGGPDAETLREIMMPVLLDPERSEETGHRGFALWLCWFLGHDPTDAVTFNAHPGDFLGPVLGPDWKEQIPIKDASAMQQYFYWALFMGFATRVGDRILPDPLPVIQRALPALFAGVERVEVGAFFTALARLHPVFEGGHWWEVFGDLRADAPPEPGHITEATSLALLRLHDRGLLRLERKSDGAGRVLGAGWGRVTEICYLGEKPA